MSRLFADVKCACGLTVRAERDECGASAPVQHCEVIGCRRPVCVHDSVECDECGRVTCRWCRVQYAGRVRCLDCIAAEVADGAEEIAEVVA